MELKPPPTNVWADDRAVLRRSPIDGTGLFAGDDIEAGTVVQRRGGRLVTSIDLAVLIAAADVDPTAPYVDTITVHENAHLVMPSNSVVHFGNDSCDPTLWHAGPYELAARRDVRAGEELTVDYGTNSGGRRVRDGVPLRVGGLPRSGDQRRLVRPRAPSPLRGPLDACAATPHRPPVTAPRPPAP